MAINIQNFTDFYWKLISLGNANTEEGFHSGKDILFECTVSKGIHQIKKLFGYKEDPSYSSHNADVHRVIEAELRTIKNELTSRGIPFNEDKRERYIDESDKKRIFVTETKISFLLSPGKRAELIQNQLAADTQKYLSECRNKAGTWYKQFSRLEIINTITDELEVKINEGLTQRFGFLKNNGYYDGFFQYYMIPISWDVSGLGVDLHALKTVFPYSESVHFSDLGYRNLENQEQVNALQTLVMEKLIRRFIADQQNFACGIFYRTVPIKQPVLLIIPKLIYEPDHTLKSWS